MRSLMTLEEATKISQGYVASRDWQFNRNTTIPKGSTPERIMDIVNQDRTAKNTFYK